MGKYTRRGFLGLVVGSTAAVAGCSRKEECNVYEESIEDYEQPSHSVTYIENPEPCELSIEGKYEEYFTDS